MDIELKSSKLIDIVCILIPIALIFGVSVYFFVAFCLDSYNGNIMLVSIIVTAVAECILVFIVLLVWSYRRVHYTFTDESITIRSKGSKTKTIRIKDIQVMNYKEYRFRFSSLLYALIFQDTPGEPGCNRLCIWMKNGKYRNLGKFSYKDVYKLKEMYGSLITIFTQDP